MSDSPSDQDLVGRVRDDRNAFLDLVEDLRVELFGYCRSLTGDPFDAEDLAQETLLRAFWRMTSEPGIENPRAYLFRTATHAFIDERRRVARRGVPEELTEIPAPEAPPAVEVRDAMEKAARVLAPRERAALLLKDVFDHSLEETADTLATTVGAVKAALHRARAKLREDRTKAPVATVERDVRGDALLDAFVDAFNARDLDRLMALFTEDARAEIVGCVREDGRERIREGTMGHTVRAMDGAPLPPEDPRAEVARVGDDTVVLLWYPTDAGPALGDVLRVEARDGHVATLRYWYFSPEVLEEIAGVVGEPARPNGHRFTPGCHP